jgi:hypothetical protein
LKSLRRLFCYLTHGPRRRSSIQSSRIQVFELVLGSGPFRLPVFPPKDLLDAVWKLFHHFLLLSTSSPRPPILCTATTTGHPLLACTTLSQPTSTLYSPSTLSQPPPATPDSIQRLVSASSSEHLGRITNPRRSLPAHFFATPPPWKTTRNASRRAASPVMLVKVSPQCNNRNRAVRVCVT